MRSSLIVCAHYTIGAISSLPPELCVGESWHARPISLGVVGEYGYNAPPFFKAAWIISP